MLFTNYDVTIQFYDVIYDVDLFLISTIFGVL